MENIKREKTLPTMTIVDIKKYINYLSSTNVLSTTKESSIDKMLSNSELNEKIFIELKVYWYFLIRALKHFDDNYASHNLHVVQIQ